ncbi:hypothetical protein GGR26_003622 [Lewinella marina]|nr:hypothetical protein [Neolewinella marina]
MAEDHKIYVIGETQTAKIYGNCPQALSTYTEPAYGPKKKYSLPYSNNG